jgi:SAM-dependent methyltransferase
MADGGRAFWDAEAASFDDAPDHGLGDPEIRDAWTALLLPFLPSPPARVADLGCGTGSLSLLLADAGYDVIGIDFAAQMIERARSKGAAARVSVAVAQADAEYPPLRAAAFDAVVGRHVLWALSDAERALERWIRLLRPGGVILLIEGRWSTGAGLRAEDLARILHRHRHHVEVVPLDDPSLWGRRTDDERYLLASRS